MSFLYGVYLFKWVLKAAKSISCAEDFSMYNQEIHRRFIEDSEEIYAEDDMTVGSGVCCTQNLLSACIWSHDDSTSWSRFVQSSFAPLFFVFLQTFFSTSYTSYFMIAYTMPF